ncbi:ankyrin repeat domain-containing protein [Yoonia sp. BS5-3]|uniref:Ankyrin repeat domain-containing protein n=1 Tax=Yoonia phaeophyticola TaxID=3137369 RepID=A0ABZ2V5R9_9RHOB
MTDPLDTLRKQAKILHKSYESGTPDAIARVALVNPRAGDFKRADFLHVIARENNFPSWPQMKTAIETQGMDRAAKQQRLKIALYHGQVQVVQRLIWETPDLADDAFGLQVALFDWPAVRDVLAYDPAAATRTYGPRRPILHLAFSKMLKIWPEKQADMIAIAEALVAHGADVNDGYPAEPGSTHMLSALYGALGHAGNMPLAKWLLDRGANPDDGESLYHATELGHHDGLKMLLAAGPNPKGTNALRRAMDFDDPVMVKMLLDAGADPNEGMGTALHHAALRRCGAPICAMLLAAGADQNILQNGITAYGAARVYRHPELAKLLTPVALSAEEELLALAAENNVPAGRFIDPAKVPPAYADIVRQMIYPDQDLTHLKALIALGMPWDRPDPSGLPPVQIAGWEGLPETLAYFLSLSPDLSHINGYGGTLLSTIIHGSENNPYRAERDYLACLRLVLNAGVALPKRAISFSGVPEISEFLAEWAAQHPGQVVSHGVF